MEDINGVLPRARNLWRIPYLLFFRQARHACKMDSLGREILIISIPAAIAVAADPMASVIDTAFIGRLGAVDLAAAGVCIALYNQVSRITIFPIQSIAVSFVAEEHTLERMKNEPLKDDVSEKNSSFAATSETSQPVPEDAMETGIAGVPAKTAEKYEETPEKAGKPENGSDEKIGNETSRKKARKEKAKNLTSISTTLVFGAILGLFQALFLGFGAKVLLRLMGVKPDSPMMEPAHKYLVLRSLGSPAVLLSLATQGIFRGLKDTKTPLYATVAGDLVNLALDPLLMFVFRLGLVGAAIAHIVSQYLILLIMFVPLVRRVELVPPSLRALQFKRFASNGFLLMGRVAAVTFCTTLAASMAARLGATPMAGFQVCYQIWLTSSLLADGLAIAGQAILACAFAEKDYNLVSKATARVNQMGIVLGVGLGVFVWLFLYFGAGLFSKDPGVINYIRIGVPFVAATQPINCLAFVLDGVNYGASDFGYTAYSMILVAAGSIVSIIFLAKLYGYIGIWVALTIYMFLRVVGDMGKMSVGVGPWKFLRR